MSLNRRSCGPPCLSGSANPVPVAARNLGSLSRRFDILRQSRALVTERHPVLGHFARNAEYESLLLR